jgi:CheY-like chemotaxis protein
MKNVLFLDDSENRIGYAVVIFQTLGYEFTIVKTAEQAIKKLFEKDWDVVMLDHDLGGEVYVDSGREDCGMEVVRWIRNNHPNVRKFIIHSWNVPAGSTMTYALRNCGYVAVYCPFDTVELPKTL